MRDIFDSSLPAREWKWDQATGDDIVRRIKELVKITLEDTSLRDPPLWISTSAKLVLDFVATFPILSDFLTVQDILSITEEFRKELEKFDKDKIGIENGTYEGIATHNGTITVKSIKAPDLKEYVTLYTEKKLGMKLRNRKDFRLARRLRK